MSIQIVNGFNGPVSVTSSGKLYSLPTGFSGSLTLDGPCAVLGGGQIVQQTQHTYAQNAPSSIELVNATGVAGAFYSDANGTPWNTAGVVPYGTPVYFCYTVMVPFYQRVGEVPLGSANCVVTVTQDPGSNLASVLTSLLGTTYNDAVGTNVFTTNTAYTALGSFTASSTVRSVEINTTGLHVTDYQSEAVAVAAGFMLAVTIACFRYVLRVIRGLTEQGGDL